MAELLAIPAFNCWIRLYVVPSHLILEPGEKVLSALVAAPTVDHADLVCHGGNQSRGRSRCLLRCLYVVLVCICCLSDGI